MLLLILTVLFRIKTVEFLLLRTPCFRDPIFIFQLLFLNMTILTSVSQVDSLYPHSFTKMKVCEGKGQSAKMGNEIMTSLRLNRANLYSADTSVPLGFVLQNLIGINCYTGRLSVKISQSGHIIPDVVELDVLISTGS